ncbi:MAG: ABC transporter ATP-binding protein [Planctomycetes bacterium]|nr:ABC transporter ATP-binding protein [Planctomycetota bacterium]
MTNLALDLRELHCSFGDRQVLHNVALQLEAGDRVAITGRSGHGKTTLLRVLAGLQDADQGELKLHGRIAMQGGQSTLAAWERSLQLVFQDLGLWPTRTVAQHLMDALAAQGIRGAKAKQRSAETLKALSIAELFDRKPSRLSGGEARRVALARALVSRPQLLLLDEPFASLDAESRADGFALLEQVLAESNAAVVLVTHDHEEAKQLNGRILQLNEEGQLR